MQCIGETTTLLINICRAPRWSDLNMNNVIHLRFLLILHVSLSSGTQLLLVRFAWAQTLVKLS
jgi:hypothetical protein